MTKKSTMLAAVSFLLGTMLVIASAVGVTKSIRSSPGGVRDVLRSGDPQIPRGKELNDLVTSLQLRLTKVPKDHVAWATIGLAYVQMAKVTVDPSYYPRAEAALARSQEVSPKDNYLAFAGLSALASARHDFFKARDFANEGLSTNPFSAVLYGALSDAELQLGRYDEAAAAVQRMVDLAPDTASLSRASYTWELRGNTDEARRLMQRALDDAGNASNAAFALVHLGTLADDHGDANGALGYFRAALEASPTDVAALAGKAKAEAALGQIETALDDYQTVVTRAPEPGYLIEYARLLESAGRADQSREQYRVLAITQRLFAENGVAPDAAEALFEAERGDPIKAMEYAERGAATRPFLTMFDARAWALHAAGRDEEALQAMKQAMVLGTRSALFDFHLGMISLSLGDQTGARSALSAALDLNPTFDPLSAPIARSTLATLTATP